MGRRYVSRDNGIRNFCDISEPADTCTVEESFAFRKRLRLVGEDQFITESIEAGTISAKKLCTAFGIRPPSLLEGQPDHKYYPLLGLGITRELSKRVKLPEHNTIDDAVELLKRSQNIIVLTGAGVSLFGEGILIVVLTRNRSQPASESLTSGLRKLVYIPSLSISGLAIRKRSLTSAFSERIPVSFTLLLRISFQQAGKPPLLMPS